MKKADSFLALTLRKKKKTLKKWNVITENVKILFVKNVFLRSRQTAKKFHRAETNKSSNQDSCAAIMSISQQPTPASTFSFAEEIVICLEPDNTKTIYPWYFPTRESIRDK